MLAENSSFSKKLPKLQTAWDATSLSLLKTCPRLYEYAIIEGYTPISSETSAHLTFGKVFASSLELYRKLRTDNNDHEAALIQTIRFAITETQGWVSNEPTKTQKTLLRTIIMYLDKFQEDTLETIILSTGQPAVELSFQLNLVEIAEKGFRTPTGEDYILCGHLDRGVQWNGELWIVDNKTTKSYLNNSYFGKYNPDNQVSAYSVAGMIIFHKEIAGVIIDAAQILVNGSRFMRQPIPRTQGQLEEWLTDLQFYLYQNEHFVKMDYWPQNDKSCMRFGGCQFQSICSSDPSVRQILLDNMFERRVWDPKEPR